MSTMHDSDGADLVIEGRRFWRGLVTGLRAGHLLRDRERRATRVVTSAVVVCRVTFEPMAGQPDHLDFEVLGPESRQWISKLDVAPRRITTVESTDVPLPEAADG